MDPLYYGIALVVSVLAAGYLITRWRVPASHPARGEILLRIRTWCWIIAFFFSNAHSGFGFGRHFIMPHLKNFARVCFDGSMRGENSLVFREITGTGAADAHNAIRGK